MNKQLQNKLKAYSALSAGATLSAFAASSQIIYTEVDLTFDSSATDLADREYYVDLDGDGTNDFWFNAYNNGTGGYFLFFDNLNPSVNGIVGATSSGYLYPTNIPQGDFIGSSIAFNTSFSYGSLNFAGGYGNFIGVTDAYIGVRFSDGTDNFYGWIRVDVSSDAQTWTVKDFAYNSTPDTRIEAGQLPLSVKENKRNTNIFVDADNVNIMTDGSLMNAKVDVVNMLGQSVAKTVITSNATAIAKSFGSGIFIVRISDENGKVITRKIKI
jgi:hypothetical protein